MTSTAETTALVAKALPSRARLVQRDVAVPSPRSAGVRAAIDDTAMAARLLALSLVEGDSFANTDVAAATADLATALWMRYLRFDAADPHWPDRDRLVVSSPAGATVVRAVRSLLADPAAGVGSLHGVPDPPADADGAVGGLGTGIGMALAERALTARFGRSLVDHRTWVLACGVDFAQGLGHEAASLAGQLRLERLTVLWAAPWSDDGADGGSSVPETLRRFAAYGWATKSVEAGDPDRLSPALGMALRARKPTLVAYRARAPAAVANPAACMDDQVTQAWLAAGARGVLARRSWLKRAMHHPLRLEFHRVLGGRLAESLDEALRRARDLPGMERGAVSTRQASEAVLAAIASSLPELAGGSTMPASPGFSTSGMYPQTASSRSRFVSFGRRDHAMAAALNGMAAHGGVLPCGHLASGSADHLRPALRAAAAAGRRLIHVVADDAPADVAGTVEHLASLRAVPNLLVLRPADPAELIECWGIALRRADGPSVILVDDEAVPRLRAEGGGWPPRVGCASGGYLLADTVLTRRATLIATGPDVARATAARARLAADRIEVAVVSLPCWELLAQEDAAYRADLLGEAPRFGVEAGNGFGWERWLGADGLFLGAAPVADIVAAVRQRLGV